MGRRFIYLSLRGAQRRGNLIVTKAYYTIATLFQKALSFGEGWEGLSQLLIPYPLRRYIAQTFLAVFLVIAVVAFKKVYLRVAFKSQDVGTDTIKEPTVVTDDYGAAGKVFQSFF
jgi:hypothetical protein